ncbi:MAG: hypothetical protein Q8P50_01450 [Bacillota bacterium]|nr:hypothetical protein [Bacillota bacterium]
MTHWPWPSPSRATAGRSRVSPGSPPTTISATGTTTRRPCAPPRRTSRSPRTGLPLGVRYVTIAGQVPNVWSAWWPEVGPNDIIVETSSTFLPLTDNDVYHLLPSLFTTNHVWLGGSGASWRAIVSALDDYYPVRVTYKPRYIPGRSRLVEYVRRGRARAEVYQPYYLELGLPAEGTARVRLAPGIRPWHCAPGPILNCRGGGSANGPAAASHQVAGA